MNIIIILESASNLKVDQMWIALKWALGVEINIWIDPGSAGGMDALWYLKVWLWECDTQKDLCFGGWTESLDVNHFCRIFVFCPLISYNLHKQLI